MNVQTQQFTLRDGSTLSLHPVTPADEEFLLTVYASTRAQELDQVEWQPGQRQVFVKWQFEMQREQYQLRFPDAEYNVICVDEERVGRIWIGRGSDEIRLLDIALLPKSQNRGVGTILLRRLIDEANVSGKALRHMVFVLNNDAHRFYERLGFVEIEDTGGYKHMEYRSESRVMSDE